MRSTQSIPPRLSEGAYLFFDELQEMAGWGSWLRHIVATRKATIYVSGSSSKMLSTEIATEFRGRALDFELLPFSFREYAAAHDIAGLDAVARSTEEELRLEEVFRRYLRDGGFPQRSTCRRAALSHSCSRMSSASSLATSSSGIT